MAAKAPHAPPTALLELLDGAEGWGVRLAVIDSGRDPEWKDPRVVPGISLVGDEGFTLAPSEDDHDRIGQGTAISELIVRFAPGVEIVPIRIFAGRLETSPEVLLAALERALDLEVDIVNLSLGTLREGAAESLYQACERATSAGILLISALHRHVGWSFPAAFDNVLGVGAGRFDSPWRFELHPSETAECLAAGEHTVRWLGGEERRVFASSFAAPVVSALAARFREQQPEAGLGDLRRLLARVSSLG